MNRRGFLKLLGLAPVAVAATTPASAASPVILPPAELASAPPFLGELPSPTCVLGILDAKDINEWAAQRANETLALFKGGRFVGCTAHDTLDVIKNLPQPARYEVRMPGDE